MWCFMNLNAGWHHFIWHCENTKAYISMTLSVFCEQCQSVLSISNEYTFTYREIFVSLLMLLLEYTISWGYCVMIYYFIILSMKLSWYIYATLVNMISCLSACLYVEMSPYIKSYRIGWIDLSLWQQMFFSALRNSILFALYTKMLHVLLK